MVVKMAHDKDKWWWNHHCMPSLWSTPLNLDQPLHQLEGHTMTPYNDVIAFDHLPFLVYYLPFGQPFWNGLCNKSQSKCTCVYIMDGCVYCMNVGGWVMLLQDEMHIRMCSCSSDSWVWVAKAQLCGRLRLSQWIIRPDTSPLNTATQKLLSLLL